MRAWQRVVRAASVGAVAATVVAAQAGAQITFTGNMTQGAEVPPTGSPATGFTSGSIFGNTLTVHVDYSGLIGGNPAAAHIHCCVAPGSNVGVAVGFPGFPATTSGTYDHVFDLSLPGTYTTGFLNTFGGGTAAGARLALVNGLLAGQAYSNIHNGQFPGGEIRGLLVTATPEPSTYALMVTGLGALGMIARRRRQA